MTELISINAKVFININTSLGLLTICVCYLFAEFYHHVNTILPMISDCFIYEPENYISRFGVISFIAFGNLISNILIANYVSIDKSINTILTCISFLNYICFGIVGSISEQDNLPVHNFFALTGYISYAFFLLIIHFTSVQTQRNKTIYPYISILLIKCINLQIKFKPVIEWLLTIFYSINMYIFSSQMKDQYITIRI